MGYCLILLIRFKCPSFFAEKFLSKFTWRGSWYQVPFSRFDEYKENYDQFQVFFKSYPTNDADVISMKKKIITDCCIKSLHLNIQNIETNIIDTILEYSELQLSELVYQFRIWKSNFMYGKKSVSSGKRYGVGWNIKRIFHECVSELGLKLSEISKNTDNHYKFTLCVLEPSFYSQDDKSPKLMYHDLDFDLEYWWKWLVTKKKNEKYDAIDIDTDILYGFDSNYYHGFPKWGKVAKYPPILQRHGSTIYTFSEEIDSQIFKLNDKNNPWTDKTNEILKKLDNQAFERFFADSKGEYRDVLIGELTSKTGMLINGLTGKIVDDYDFERERWPIQIASKEKPEFHGKCFKLKSCDLVCVDN